MDITRFSQAQPYSAIAHHGMVGLRLQGAEATKTDNFWVGYSQFLPNGGAENGSTPFEKVYVVLEGQLTIIEEGKEVTLGPMDSCRISPNTDREIINKTNSVASMLVVIPNS